MSNKIYNNRYEVMEELGTGSFSIVYKAKVLEKARKISHENVEPSTGMLIEESKAQEAAKAKFTGEYVALKKLKNKLGVDGMDFSTLREIKILKEISYHPNIIKLVDVFVEKKETFLVIEYMKLDLDTLIRLKGDELTEADVKSITYQTLCGLSCLHQDWILHRDMKPGNILIAEDGTVKISDFGSSRYYGSPNREMTSKITTRFYRAPEMLYGTKFYGPGVDLWAAGCIMAEMIMKKFLFPGTSEIDQLSKIFSLRGTPNEETWPELLEMPNYIPFEPVEKIHFRKILPHASEETIDLLERLLEINPNRRIKTEEALNHPYFTTGPPMSESTYQKLVKDYLASKK